MMGGEEGGGQNPYGTSDSRTLLLGIDHPSQSMLTTLLTDGEINYLDNTRKQSKTFSWPDITLVCLVYIVRLIFQIEETNMRYRICVISARTVCESFQRMHASCFASGQNQSMKSLKIDGERVLTTKDRSQSFIFMIISEEKLDKNIEQFICNEVNKLLIEKNRRKKKKKEQQTIKYFHFIRNVYLPIQNPPHHVQIGQNAITSLTVDLSLSDIQSVDFLFYRECHSCEPCTISATFVTTNHDLVEMN